ncbi:MAG: type II restriction endonuclease MjaI [Candidatus Kapaibacterium sp.]|nr:MAG: type II restriction endonuclease MjaI [Candidatus Kapabacteria bacterium]
MKITLSSAEVRELLDAPPPKLPTYVSPILNLANRFASGTRPKVVGQMSELIKQFDGRTLDEWAEWYQRRHPDAIAHAVRLIRDKLTEFQQVIENITDEMIESWVKDLVIVKTFVGLKFQEAILKKVAESTGHDYSLASPEQEARGIDGLIGGREVSIKPASWKDQVIQRESLQGVLIYYRKTEDGLEIEFEPADF